MSNNNANMKNQSCLRACRENSTKFLFEQCWTIKQDLVFHFSFIDNVASRNILKLLKKIINSYLRFFIIAAEKIKRFSYEHNSLGTCSDFLRLEQKYFQRLQLSISFSFTFTHSFPCWRLYFLHQGLVINLSVWRIINKKKQNYFATTNPENAIINLKEWNIECNIEILFLIWSCHSNWFSMFICIGMYIYAHNK